VTSLKIAVVDYGAGNLRSVAKALETVGLQPHVTADYRDLARAEGIVFPGQGIAGPAMDRLKATGMDAALKDAVGGGAPFFGVCLGLQLLFDVSEEGDTPCLGILRGRVPRFPQGVKVPHMGWNDVRFVRPHPAFRDVPEGAQFYFVHSYYGMPEDWSVTVGETDYGGVTFASVVARDNLLATQFHPEKSGRTGIQLYRNFFLARKGE
jgi:glutamine amidotransferase